MTVTVCEQTYVPNTPEGKKFADEYQKKLISQDAFLGRHERELTIMLSAAYHHEIKEDENDEDLC